MNDSLVNVRGRRDFHIIVSLGVKWIYEIFCLLGYKLSTPDNICNFKYQLRSRYTMDGLSHQMWMYYKIDKFTTELWDEFISGVE